MPEIRFVAGVKEEIVGAWDSGQGFVTAQVVFRTSLGTAHVVTRKWHTVPEEIKRESRLVKQINTAFSEEVVPPPAPLPPTPKIHPLLIAPDSELAAAFSRFVADPASVSESVGLSDWEFKFACDAPGVFAKWGGFTWKQRKYLREIAKKILR